MIQRTYPRKVWVLQPSFKPIEVEVVKRYDGWVSDTGDQTAKGKLYSVSAMYATKTDAIASGWAKIAAMHAELELRQENINKKKSVLKKARDQ